ncbi:MAG: S46 family peptidase [Bacteroidales bacterium]|nr:S46 family peptidase [Bacteroidales bacterium]
MKKISLIVVAMLAIGLQARADEGMWMVNAITKALEANMQAKGLKLSAGEIYNSDAPGTALTDAIVALDFACSGSVISDQGLVITNHHCAYSDVHALSTSEHNYLEDGFWAMHSNEEIYIPGKSIFFLKKVLDVTDEVAELIASEEAAGRVAGSRRISHLMESKYSKQTGLEASLSSMWAGSKYYLALYEVYTDIRLVAAPPVSISAFGGDIDNWEWPQHKCDFAMYRIYADESGRPAKHSEKNVPLHPTRKLQISSKGYQDGDFAMVLGYPGRTDRYSTSYKVDFLSEVSLPISNEIRGKEMEIVNKWMNADPAVRLKYSDFFFSLSNVQENNEGEVQCIKRFCVVDEKREKEAKLQEWILADPVRTEKWGNTLAGIEKHYALTNEFEKSLICFRETLVRGSKYALASMRLKNNGRSGKMTRQQLAKLVADIYAEMDMRVENDLLKYSVEKYCEGVDSALWGPYQKELFAAFSGNVEKMASYLIEQSWMTSEKQVTEFLTDSGTKTTEEYINDPMIRFLSDVSVSDFNTMLSEIEQGEKLLDYDHAFTQAMYQMNLDKGIPQYPNANSTMRVTYGTVGGYEPKDGIWLKSTTYTSGILQKYDPTSYEFNLKSDWKALLELGSYVGPVNFLTDCDITGGNSGSPVLNGNGELIGLAFDGNKESLASDVSCTPGYNQCVCVDIRYVLWTLKYYAHMDRIIAEINE